MSQWVPSSKNWTSSSSSPEALPEAALEAAPAAASEGTIGEIKESLENSSDIAHTELDSSKGKPGSPLRTPWWVRLVPFFLSALIFLSAFFALFAPLPMMFFNLQKGRKWALLAILTNGAIVAIAGGLVSLAFYTIFVAMVSFTLSEFLRKKISLERSVMMTLLSMGLCAVLFVVTYGQIFHLNPLVEFQTHVSTFVDYLAQSVAQHSGMGNSGDTEEWKRSLVVEFPSAVAIFSLVLVWANLVLLLRVNPNRIREHLGLDSTFLKKWKTPEYLVWPTIFTGFFLVVDFGLASDVALNFFKFLMAIYAIQGLSILSYFFDLWGVRGIFRFIGFSVALFLMMPLVLSLGFFDLWFDFRGKFRQA